MGLSSCCVQVDRPPDQKEALGKDIFPAKPNDFQVTPNYCSTYEEIR
jgi:hypothetical protein